MRATVIASVIALLCSVGVSAQTLQPRCGGWPADRGSPGMIIGGIGEPCYGSLVYRVPATSMLREARIRKTPSQGKFRLVGATSFEFVPSAGQKAIESVLIDLVWDVRGQAETETITLRVTSDELYAKLGGAADRPPPGEAVGRATPTMSGQPTR